jgi:hypothetical protein
VKPQIGVVPLDVATGIAKNFFKMYYANVENKDVDNQVTIDENGVPIFYLFNYKGGGFLIVSGEYGDVPILANGVSNVFPAKNEKINPGLGIWLIDTRNRIVAIREGKEPVSPIGAAMWQDLKNNTLKTKFKNITIDDIRRNGNNAQLRWDEDQTNSCDVPYTQTQVGPLITTAWGQGCGYNALVPEATSGPCGRAVTGCVATSMAQIIRFHRFPSIGNFSYNYDIMPNNSGNNEVAKLMRDCGWLVDMSYGADGSSAQTGDVEDALEDIGYSSDIDYSNYSANIHEGDLNAGRPVILRGCTSYSCFWWWCWGTENCHAWVSDGYRKMYHPCYGSYPEWHMNWGWNGQGPNGFYYNPKPTDEAFNFQYDRKILHCIHH